MSTSAKPILFGLGLTAILAAGGAVPAAAAPTVSREDPPASAAITLVAAGGTGCSASDTSVDAGPSNKSLGLHFRKFAAIAPGDEDKKTCNVTLRVRSESGWSFSLRSFWLNGIGEFHEGADGTLLTGSFVGTQPTVSGSRRYFSNDAGSRWSHQASMNQQQSSGCKSVVDLGLTVVGQVQAGQEGGPGHLKVDGLLISVNDLQWKRC